MATLADPICKGVKVISDFFINIKELPQVRASMVNRIHLFSKTFMFYSGSIPLNGNNWFRGLKPPKVIDQMQMAENKTSACNFFPIHNKNHLVKPKGCPTPSTPFRIDKK